MHPHIKDKWNIENKKKAATSNNALIAGGRVAFKKRNLTELEIQAKAAATHIDTYRQSRHT